MRNILDTVHRELSVTKRKMTETEDSSEEYNRSDQQESPSSTEHQPNLRGQMNDNSMLEESSFSKENLRGSSKKVQRVQRRRKLLSEDDRHEVLFNRESATLDLLDSTDHQAFITADPISTNTTTLNGINTTAIGNGIVNGSGHELDIGAWLFMVLVMGLAVFGFVSSRSANNSLRRRRRGSNDYHYKGVNLPTLREEDWGED